MQKQVSASRVKSFCILHSAFSIFFCARSSKRAGGLIPRIALDQCRVPERYRTRVPIFVLIAQNTELARPRRQVADEIAIREANLGHLTRKTWEVNPAGNTTFAGAFAKALAMQPRVEAKQLSVPVSASSGERFRCHKRRSSAQVVSFWRPSRSRDIAPILPE
jgi:hypothetical protein